MSSPDSTSISNAALTLAACLRGGRLPHAILIEGPSEESNIVFAGQIAKAALCSGETRPCGDCRHCQKAERGVHPDILTFSGGEGARSFHIDTVREIRQQAFIRPNEADAKVFILKNAQNMSVQAQNALLKIIEEPPCNVIFILTCENKSVLLPTVLSRVAVFSLDKPPADQAENKSETRERAKTLLRELCAGSELTALAGLAKYERDRTGFADFLEELRTAALDELLAKTKDPALELGQGRRISRLQLLKMIAIIDEVSAAARQNMGGLLVTALLPAKFKGE